MAHEAPPTRNWASKCEVDDFHFGFKGLRSCYNPDCHTVYSPIFPHAHNSPTRTLAHPPIRLFAPACPPNRPRAHPPRHPIIHSPTRPLTQPSTRPLAHSPAVQTHTFLNLQANEPLQCFDLASTSAKCKEFVTIRQSYGLPLSPLVVGAPQPVPIRPYTFGYIKGGSRISKLGLAGLARLAWPGWPGLVWNRWPGLGLGGLGGLAWVAGLARLAWLGWPGWPGSPGSVSLAWNHAGLARLAWPTLWLPLVSDTWQSLYTTTPSPRN